MALHPWTPETPQALQLPGAPPDVKRDVPRQDGESYAYITVSVMVRNAKLACNCEVRERSSILPQHLVVF